MRTLEALEQAFDGGLPPVKPPTRPVKLGNGGDRKAAQPIKRVAPMPPSAPTLTNDACPAQAGRPDFADDIDRLVAQLLRDGDVRWSETQGYHAPRRTFCFTPTELTNRKAR